MERRILIHAPLGQNATLASKVLTSARIDSVVCRTLEEVFIELGRGAGALLTVEEVIASGAMAPLARFVAGQPTWSDLPILLLTDRGVDSGIVKRAVDTLGNVTLLERPIRTAALVSAARSALRARSRQYQVRDADQRKDEFIASLGHELRNPLAPIRTSMGILKHLYPDVAPVTQVRTVVERQITHLTRLVDDLLDVARITSGKVTLQRDPVSMSAVMLHAVEICSALVESRQHVIDIDYPRLPVMLHADHARLVQSLANVLANAAKFTLTPGRIVFRAAVEGDTVIFRIRDFGIGLEPQWLTRIFDMFAQTQPVEGQAPSGLGVGLSLAKQFTEMHGGRISVASEGLGRGCEFTLALPIVIDREAIAAGPVGPTPTPADIPRLRVLVVDDNVDAAETLCALFEAEGFPIASAADGYEAVEKAREVTPEIVVMDIGLPGIDGYEAARRIRQQPGGGHMLLIALTGWGQAGDRRLAEEAGFDHHLVKPVDFDTLKSCIMRSVASASHG